MPMPVETRAHMICADIRQILLSYPAVAAALDQLESESSMLQRRMEDVVTAGLQDITR